ncbi:hypothetical protein PI125_g1686 [Phytophthora idaei]|nr:hypothetical protein PI125_g1686 [Phytophthora idaei]
MVSERDGLSLWPHRRSVHRARGIVNGMSLEALAESYKKIQANLAQFEQLNTGPIAIMKRDSENRFMRAMISVKVVADSVEHNQRVLGIDRAHPKSALYDGV